MKLEEGKKQKDEKEEENAGTDYKKSWCFSLAEALHK